MTCINVTDTTGRLIGRIEPVKLAERAVGAPAVTYTDAYSAEVLNASGTHWTSPGGCRHYPTAAAAREAILAARTETAPTLPKGLRLGTNQKWALWTASIGSNGLIEDRHGPALAKKGLAVDDGWCRYSITDLGRQAAGALFDTDGNPR